MTILWRCSALALALVMITGCPPPPEDEDAGGGGKDAGAVADSGSLDTAVAADSAGSDRAVADTTTAPDTTAAPDRTTTTDTATAPDTATTPDANVTPPDLVWISITGGTFAMGCSEGDTICYASENPSHAVTVTAFHMLATEVTQAQYLSVMGDNPSYFSQDGAGADCGLDCPVEQIDWNQANTFCEAVGGRLPSEAEWEYAARAGTTTRYSCGYDNACLDSVAWYADNSGSTTHPVGTKVANAFGLYDMHGNVGEWVEDCWHADYNGAPVTGEAWLSGDCDNRVTRDGSWDHGNQGLHISRRSGNAMDWRSRGIGARCAK